MKRHSSNWDSPRRRTSNVVRSQSNFLDQIRQAGIRAKLASNQPANLRSRRNIRAALAQEEYFDQIHLGIGLRFFRWLIALFLIPLCIVTTWTLFSEFAHQAQQQHFWLSKQIWFFSLGSALMVIAFFSGLWRRAFLHLYVLGHELTHAFFVIFHFGQVTKIKASAQGGYITTNKSNILISLSPYFFPFWSVSIISLYGLPQWFTKPPLEIEPFFYAALGASWTFHLCWTLWMIPRDQPDLKENDTFFSLVFIYFSNILVLSMMLCAASHDLNFASFFVSWWIHAVEFAELCQQVMVLFSK